MCDFKFRHLSILARKWTFYIYHDKNLPMSAGCVLLSVTLDSVPRTLNIVSHDQEWWEALQIYWTGPGHSSLTLDQVKSSRPLKTYVFNFSPSGWERRGEGLSIATAGSSGHLILQNSELFPGGDSTTISAQLITRNKIFRHSPGHPSSSTRGAQFDCPQFGKHSYVCLTQHSYAKTHWMVCLG